MYIRCPVCHMVLYCQIPYPVATINNFELNINITIPFHKITRKCKCIYIGE